MRVVKIENGCPSLIDYESKRSAVAGIIGSYSYYDNTPFAEDVRRHTITNSDGNEDYIYEDLRDGKYYTSRTALVIGRAGNSNSVTVGKTTLIFGMSEKQYNKIVDAMNKAILSVVENYL